MTNSTWLLTIAKDPGKFTTFGENFSKKPTVLIINYTKFLNELSMEFTFTPLEKFINDHVSR